MIYLYYQYNILGSTANYAMFYYHIKLATFERY